MNAGHDLFRNRLLVGGHVLQSYQGELSDNACAMLRQAILDEFGFDPGKDHVRDAAHALCLENSFDPVVEYLDGVRWDGTPTDRRVAYHLPWCGVHEASIAPSVGSCSSRPSDAPVSPGTKFDNIVVLEGPQGSGKSSAVAILAGRDYFSDQDLLTLDAKAQMEALEGVWLFEIPELAGMRRADVEKIKAFASRWEDRARPAYGRFRENRPRRCIFVGTTNDEEYLNDPTGNRRFWPVRDRKPSISTALRVDRDQLWAEAAALEAAGESITLNPALWPEAAGPGRANGGGHVDRDAPDGQGHPHQRHVSGLDQGSCLKRTPYSRGEAIAYMRTRLRRAMERLGWTYKV